MNIVRNPFRPLLVAAIFVPASVAAQLTSHDHLEEIVITADPLAAADDHVGTPVDVVDQDALRERNLRSIGDAVAGELGVNSADFGPSVGRPVIRGLGGARVRVLEDGIGTLDVSTISADHAVTVDALFADQVEIFRGPATLLYGSGASGGLVNVVNRRVPQRRPDGGVSGGVVGEYESNGEAWLGAGSVDVGLPQGLVLHLDALTRDSGVVDIPGFAAARPAPGDRRGVLENSDAVMDNGAVGLSKVGERGYLGVAVSHLSHEYGIPGTDGVRIDLQQTRVDVAGEYAVGERWLETVRTRWGFNNYEHSEIEGDGEVGTRFNNDAVEGRVELIHAPLGRWSGAVGMQYQDRDFAATGEEAFVPPATLESFAFFILEKADFGPWHVDLGARYEHQDSDSAALSTNHDVFSISGGAGWRYLEGYLAGINVTHAGRAPTIEELFARGPHLATNTFELGDPGLGDETSTNIDVYWRRTRGRLTLDFTAFYNRIDDFVYLAASDRNGDGVADRVEEDFGETAAIVMDDAALLLVDQTQADAELWGFELEAVGHLHEGAGGFLDLRLWSDYVRGQLRGGADLPRIPPLRFGADLDWHRGPLSAKLSVSRVTGQDQTAPLETATDGFTLLSAFASYRLPWNGPGALSVYARGANLLDEPVRRHVSFLKDRAVAPGISAVAGIRLDF